MAENRMLCSAIHACMIAWSVRVSEWSTYAEMWCAVCTHSLCCYRSRFHLCIRNVWLSSQQRFWLDCDCVRIQFVYSCLLFHFSFRFVLNACEQQRQKHILNIWFLIQHIIVLSIYYLRYNFLYQIQISNCWWFRVRQALWSNVISWLVCSVCCCFFAFVVILNLEIYPNRIKNGNSF